MKNNRGITELGLYFIVVGIIVLIFIITTLYPRIFGNKEVLDLHQTYNKAITSINGEKIEIEIDRWNDYEGEQIQIKSKDGKVYLVSSFNTILIGE